MRFLRFSAVVKIRGINPYVFVSRVRARSIQADWRRPMPVRVRIDEKPRVPWRINLMPAGDGSYYLYLHNDIRKAAKVSVGDRVHVAIAFDANYKGGPIEPLPPSFKAALQKNSKARTHWQSLPPSRQKEVVRYLARLKSGEALTRNVKQAITALSGASVRFMARNWQDGR